MNWKKLLNGDVLFGMAVVAYIITAMATHNWYKERYPIDPDNYRYGNSTDAGAAGIVWPLYWTYKAVDVIVCPDPIGAE